MELRSYQTQLVGLRLERSSDRILIFSDLFKIEGMRNGYMISPFINNYTLYQVHPMCLKWNETHNDSIHPILLMHV